ncbi:MAG: hypothetical protein LBR12_02210 [Opitutaceae bacterium]|jgi:ADP-heptose:LPS heptosyltransferase|nr:hypothetical protein [Opitutaceae bacterium]
MLAFEQKSKWFGVAVRGINGVGRLLLGKGKPVPVPEKPRGILVGKCDHLGDLMMITDFLMTARERAPGARIGLIHGAWCAGLARRLVAAGMVDELIQYSPLALNRMKEGFWKKVRREISEFFTARRLVARGNYEVFFELRPFSGNTLHIARLAGVPCRIGFALREFGFSVNHALDYSDAVPLGQLFNNAARFLGVEPRVYKGPRVTEAFWPAARADGAGKFALLHVYSGNPIKNLGDAAWGDILRLLRQSGWTPLLVGAAGERAALEALKGDGSGEVCCGDLEGTLEACRRARVAITVDSFVAHLVLAAGRDLIVIGPERLKHIVARALPLGQCHYLAKEGDCAGGIRRALETQT